MPDNDALSPVEVRLYRMMQMVMRHEAVPPEPGPDRGVGAQEAMNAIVQVAAVLDAAFQAGLIPADKAAHAGAMLMVVRERIQPLPPVVAPDGRDAYGDDVRGLVETLRDLRAPDVVPEDWT